MTRKIYKNINELRKYEKTTFRTHTRNFLEPTNKNRNIPKKKIYKYSPNKQK